MIITQHQDTSYFMELPPKLLLNDSYNTSDTDTTTASDFSDEYDDEPWTFSSGAFRLGDLMDKDCNDNDNDNDDDTLSVITKQTSCIDYEEESAGSLPPQEIVILNEHALEQNQTVGDMQQRWRIAETLARSYKEKLQSTEELADSLQENLMRAQDYAESALADRDELLRYIEDTQVEERSRFNISILLKTALATSLCYYLCGGTPTFLVGSVGLNLLSDALITFS